MLNRLIKMISFPHEWLGDSQKHCMQMGKRQDGEDTLDQFDADHRFGRNACLSHEQICHVLSSNQVGSPHHLQSLECPQGLEASTDSDKGDAMAISQHNQVR